MKIIKEKIMKAIWYGGLLLATLSVSGCFLFGVKGIFTESNYQIVKLEIDNGVILSPQELANQAREQIQSVHGYYIPDYGTQKQAGRMSDLHASFEELRQRNQDEDEETNTPVATLASITMKATFNLDRSQDMLYGKAGCNDYTAKFFWQDTTKIVISGAASTRKPCAPNEVARFQNTFVRNLDGIYVITKLKNRKGYVLNNGRMRIYIK